MVIFFLTGCGGGGTESSSSFVCNLVPSSLSKVILGGAECKTPLPFGITKVTITKQDGSVELCSGSLISSRKVLTAAHCLVSASKVDVTINLSEEWTNLSFSIHPNYRTDNQIGAIFSDVALINLPSPSSQTPITLNPNYTPQIGETLRVFGFGRSTTNQIGELSAGNVVVTNVTKDHIFSAFDGKSDNPCFGDSGGPAISLTSLPIIVGVISSGSNNNCGKGDVTLYTNLSEKSVSDWVM